ncbi:sushi, von Willebrand factor type A, EGF and pentraxin domain-containing protein 1-like [Haliotis rufescens]|uniref:sushi, von Willebrand factor type A, EGF and pentraxin domain-containing protein 1-like n=1 Tax=Haliotis rufescens TaxID=6454 RepID=UPI00201EFD34|nr:sushi, von Willebrand factor type A, EGF and pentraxin domain-containing protein 1-like [Haliotis rufescens]
MYIVILMYIAATTPKLASGYSSFSKEIPNACLRDALFWKRHVSNRFQCETLCLMLRMCQSVNYRTTDRICHINFKKAYDVHSVVLEKGTTYISDRKNKTSTPCRWGTCKVNEICAVVQRTNKMCLPFEILCKAQSAITHSTVILRIAGDRSYTSKADHTCDPGYILQGGTGEVECQSDGQWSQPTGHCEAIECTAPKAIHFASVGLRVAGNRTYTAKADHTCEPGYILQGGTGEVECQSDAQWSEPTGHCEAIECTAPKAIHFASVGLRVAGNRTYTAKADHTCEPGYILQGGTGEVECQSDAQWSEPTGQCQGTCPSNKGYKFDNDTSLCYKIFTSSNNRTHATKDCDNDSGRLIILNTSDKHKRIVRELLENYGGPRYYFQVGGKKEASGDWVWLNGNVIDSTGPHWFPGSPDGDGICMDLMIKNSIDGLNDYSCRSQISFICEIPI